MGTMKLLSAIAAVAVAENNWWPGQPGGAACGSQLTYEDASVAVNSTCTVKLNGFAAQHVSIPNCFNAGQGSFDSIDCEIVVGGGSLDVLVFWEQAGNDTWVDESTCGNWTDIDVSCTDNGAAPAGKLIGNIANNYHSGDDLVKLNFDVYGAGDDGTSVALQFKMVKLALSSTLLALHAAPLLLTIIQSVSPQEMVVNSLTKSKSSLPINFLILNLPLLN